MIGLLVLAIIAWNFYIGYRRGLFMQAYYVVSVIIAMCVAAYFYRSLGEAINLWVPYKIGRASCRERVSSPV